MTSKFAQLFIAIQNRIKAITIDSAPAFKFIDQDLMQLESHNGDERPPVSWPAVTIDLDDARFENMGDNAQTGVITVCIRIGFPPFSAASSITPANYRNKALYFYDLEDALHRTLQGWSPGTVTIDDTVEPSTTADLSNVFGHFIRTSAKTEKRNDRIRVRQLTYTLSMDDYCTKPTITYIPASINLTPQIIVPE
jgi:hypothetical protein